MTERTPTPIGNDGGCYYPNAWSCWAALESTPHAELSFHALFVLLAWHEANEALHD